MAWPIIAAAGIAASSALHQQLTGQKFQEKANRQNMDFQREMAQNSIQYRVQDARNAGIHPLYALGAQPYQASPSSVAPDTSAIGQAGAQIAGLVAGWKQNQQQIQMNELQIQNMKLKNQALQDEITSNKLGQTLDNSNRSQIPFFSTSVDSGVVGQADLDYSNSSRRIGGLHKQTGSFYQLESVPGRPLNKTLGVTQDKADLVSEDLATKVKHYKLMHNPFAYDRQSVLARQVTYEAHATGEMPKNMRYKPVWYGLIDGWEYVPVYSSFSDVDTTLQNLRTAKHRHRGVYYGE